MAPMRPLTLVLPVVLVLPACGTSSTTTPETTPPADAAAATVVDEGPAAAGGTATLHASVAEAATGAPKVEKIKLRLDKSGAIVKQAVYHDDESRIAAPVLELAKKEFPGSKPVHFETEWYADLGDVQEVEVETADGKHCEVAAKPTGELVYKECGESPESLPDPVKKAVDAAVPGGKILEAESKKGPDVDQFSIEVESGGVEYYLIITPDGTMQHKLKRIPAIVEVPVD